MKTPRISGLIRSHLTRWFFGCSAAMAIATAPLMGEVSVTFNNTTLSNTLATSIGTVTLAFTVDGSGNVTLDASTNSVAAGAAAAVDAWDGAVGTITDSAAFGSTFTVTLKGVGSGISSNDLRMCNLTGGSPVGGVIGVPGTNQYRVDSHQTGTANNEYIQLTATSVPAGSKLKLTAIGWNNANTGGPFSMTAFRTAAPSISLSNPVTTLTGTWDLSTSGVLLDAAQVINFGTTVNANNNYGYSFKALSVDIVSASTLSAPAGLVATTDGSQVVLDWNDTTNATSYSVYRSETLGGPYGTAIATGLATSDYTDTTVSTGTTYYYVVTASDGTAESADSTEVAVPVLIPAPTGLTRTQGDSAINLDWADSTSPIFASYSVYRSTTSGSGYTSIATGLTTSAYEDTGLTNGTTYYYVVRAVDNVEGSGAESANSAEVSGTPYVPISGSTLYAHLDGSVAESVSATSNIVSAWAAQSGTAFNATSTGGTGTVNYPSSATSENGLGGLDMGYTSATPPKSTLTWFTAAQQDSWLDFSSGAKALPYGGFTVFAVVHPNAILGGNNRDVVMSSTEAEFALRYEAGKPQVRLGGTVLESPVASVTANQTVLLAVKYNASTGGLELWDSESSTTRNATVAAADFSSVASIFLGGSANPEQYMKGMLGEVKVYRGVMTANEYLAERASLVEKWVSDPIPSGVALTQGNGKVDLQWVKPAPNAAYTYSVYRSETSGGSYTLLISDLATNTYSDATVAPGVTYYYVVTATNTITTVESAISAEVSGSSVAPELYAHLDASVSGSVTADGSNIVSAWADQTANGFNASNTGGAGTVFFPSATQTQAGLNGLDMGLTVVDPPAPKSSLLWFSSAQQDQWLDFSPTGAALAKGGFAVLAVVHPTAILGGVNRDVVMSSTESEFALRYEGGRPQVRLGVTGAVGGATILQGTAGAVTTGRTVALAVTYDAGTGTLKLWDSNSKTTTSATVAAADFSSAAAMFLGGSANPDQYMKGVLGEVKVYRGLVAEADLIDEASSMLSTWGNELTWTGAESSEWSTAVLTGSKNWSTYGPVASDFVNGASVIFDDTAANKTVNITEANLAPASVSFNAGAYTLGGTNAIATATPVTIATGATLMLGAPNMLPDGAGAGTLRVNGTLDLNGNAETINTLTGSGSVDNTATGTTSTLSVGTSAGSTISTVIKNTVGTVALTKTGNTDVTLTGANTYSGATTVNQGRLFINGTASLPASTAVSVNNGASLVLNVTATPAPTFAQSITLNSGSNLSLRKAATLSNVTLATSGSLKFNFDDAATQAITLSSAADLTGALTVEVGNTNATIGAVSLTGILGGTGGSLVKTGAGMLSLAGANTFDGGVTILKGTLEAKTSNAALGTGTLTMGGVGSTGATLLTGRVLSNAITVNAPDSGTILIGANAAGSGYTLSGAITLSGDLTVQTFNNAIASDINNNPITSTAGISGGITGTGNLVLNNTGLAANKINITTQPVNHTGTITVQGTGTGNTTIGSVIGSNVTGITQSSATSPLILTGANTYACNLTVNAGVVTISNNTNTANDVSTVSIAATGATLNLNYSGTDTVQKLFIGGVEQAPGVYSASNTSQIIGDGTLTVTGEPVAAPEIAVEEPAETDIANNGSRDFGSVEVGQTASLTFTIRNTGDADLNLTGDPDLIAITGTDAGDFTVSAAPSASIVATDTTTFTIDFVPTAEGARTAQLSIANNDSDENPFVIDLSGTGTITVATAPEIAVEQPALTDIANNGSQDFGTVTLGSNTSLTFTVRNSGDADLNLTGNSLVEISGTDAADFTVTSGPSSTVAAAGSTTFTVQFAPSAAGARSASLSIANNDSDENPFVISLSGTGESAYDAWSGGAAFNADANGDGVSNGLAWILGAADANASARSLLPSASVSSTNLVYTFKRAQASIDASVALTVEVGTTLSAWSSTYTVGADTAGSTEGVAITKDSPSAGTDTVTVTIPRGADTKKFARLKAVQTP